MMKHLDRNMMARIIVAMTKLSTATLITVVDAGLAQIQQRVDADTNTWIRVKGKDIAQMRMALAAAAADIERGGKRFRRAGIEAAEAAAEMNKKSRS